MIELKITIADQGGGKLDIRSTGRDVAGATDIEVEAAAIVNQILRDGMANGEMGQVIKQRLTQPIVIDTTAVPVNPHGKS